jgi:predicted ArsR family transcriptional regulator
MTITERIYGLLRHDPGEWTADAIAKALLLPMDTVQRELASLLARERVVKQLSMHGEPDVWRCRMR